MALGLTPQEIVDKGEYQLLAKASHWERVLLRDVAKVQNGFAFKSSFFNRFEGVSLIRIRDISKANTEHRYTGQYDEAYIVKKGHILVGMDGDFSATRWIGEAALLNQRVCRLTIVSELFDEAFFFTCLQPFLNAINAETSSVTVKHLSSRSIETIPLPLPPLGEQERIVAKIEQLFSELDKGVEALKAAEAQLNVYRQALLKHAFEGKLTADWREANKDKLESADTLLARIKTEREARYQQQLDDWKLAVKDWEARDREDKKPAKPKKASKFDTIRPKELTGFSDLPLGWAYCRLGEFIDHIDAGKSFKCDERPPKGDEIGVAKVSAVTWGEYQEAESKTCTDPTKINPDYFIKPGDFLFSRANTIELVGACVVVRAISQRIMLSDKTLRVHIPNNLEDYILQYLRSHNGRREIMARSTGNQDSMRNIGQERIRNIVFPISGYEEGKLVLEKLGAQLSVVDHMEADVETQLKKSEALRQSILKKAFAGQLVPQDPTDEPAATLLERIKVEKTATAAKVTNAKAGPKKRRKKAS